MAEYVIKFEDKVLDNVHGFIELTRVEAEIIALPIFKRLRHLKQLSLANWVFPGAEHTRYIHSLGVMYVIDQMALRLNYDDKERQLVRLAGLLHDLGHYPLSHVGEASYQEETKVEPSSCVDSAKKICADKISKLRKPEVEIDGLMSVHSNPYHHERVTAEVIKNNEKICALIKQYCDFVKIEQICAIITGDVEYDESLSDKVQLLHSELDADRIDYLMRDATFSGTSYGGFELGLLLDNLCCVKKDGVKIVGVKPKGIPSADQFLINRFFSYGQIVFNKHVSVLGFMAQKIMYYERMKSSKRFPTSGELQAIIASGEDEQYLQFTDTIFWEAVKAIKADEGETNDEIREFAKKISVYSELEFVPGSEVRISGDAKAAFQEIKKSQTYKNIAKTDGRLPIFDSCTITKQVPIKNFNDAMKEKDMETDLKKKYLIRRLQEGLAVVEGEDIHLLVDDKRSMMPHMYNMGIYLLREYE